MEKHKYWKYIIFPFQIMQQIMTAKPVKNQLFSLTIFHTVHISSAYLKASIQTKKKKKKIKIAQVFSRKNRWDFTVKVSFTWNID